MAGGKSHLPSGLGWGSNPTQMTDLENFGVGFAKFGLQFQWDTRTPYSSEHKQYPAQLTQVWCITGSIAHSGDAAHDQTKIKKTGKILCC
ncbi:hypothetical protein ABBQ32_008876 [Trebouxia sp. C0010 RCD-2024]